eukprot:gnl/TRDRNA2_/TRDRNA2_31641_c0_seq1.p1 gnl/TRDRNA2_/TRDRNA2_31641_c0~~gnl/TRDRNA2_/TRDRNA2_31641_c0_seq1.p1  ORF type:complete len:204 (+),score=24.59 gnl/TRDRNA2_/TRDRNA2_31641_c0_seq1:120-731(+)
MAVAAIARRSATGRAAATATAANSNVSTRPPLPGLAAREHFLEQCMSQLRAPGVSRTKAIESRTRRGRAPWVRDAGYDTGTSTAGSVSRDLFIATHSSWEVPGFRNDRNVDESRLDEVGHCGRRESSTERDLREAVDKHMSEERRRREVSPHHAFAALPDIEQRLAVESVALDTHGPYEAFDKKLPLSSVVRVLSDMWHEDEL